MGLRGPKPGTRYHRSEDGSRMSARALQRIVVYPPLDELPPPPDWLPNGAAVREWKRLGELLLRVGLLNEGSLGPLGNLCALHGKIVQLWAAGETPKPTLLAQYRIQCAEFALAPKSNGKVQARVDPAAMEKLAAGKLGEVQADAPTDEDNPFARHCRK